MIVDTEKIQIRAYNSHLILVFQRDKKSISKLSYEQKMEWYAHQFQTDPFAAAITFANPEFKRFWYWNVVLPVKIRRMYYRIKNLEVFKKYQHITEMKPKLRKHGI